MLVERNSAISTCIQVLNSYKGSLPGFFPYDYNAAAAWWMREMCEPVDEKLEQPRQVAVVGSENGRQIFPYIDRVAYSLRRFLAMSHNEQIEVVAGVTEQRVPWRGEDVSTYRRICSATARMREVGRPQFLVEVKKAARGLRKSMTGGDRDE